MTPDLHRHLEERGWVRIRSVFEEGELDPIIERVRYHAGRQAVDAANPTTTDVSERGESTPRKLAESFFVDPLFRQLTFDRRIIELVAPVVGPRPELIFDHFFLKPSYYGASKHWHQDGFYYHIDPPDRGISVWLALHDADESNGCLSYYAGSHKLGLLPHYQPDGQPGLAGISMELSELGEPTPVPARRGDVLLHHFHTVHGSGTNKSPFDRFAYACHWFDPSAKAGGPAWSRTYPPRADYRALVESESLR